MTSGLYILTSLSTVSHSTKRALGRAFEFSPLQQAKERSLDFPFL